MKTLTYSIQINKPRDFVFNKLIDKSVYSQWAKAWGEGMTYKGDWKQGQQISFFNTIDGGTKVIIEELHSNESIKTKHIAMVNAQNIEQELANDMMRKWIGSREDYFFKADSDTVTTLEVIMVADEAFEEMMGAWSQALVYFKEICEA